jgi:hypothetical protein
MKLSPMTRTTIEPLERRTLLATFTVTTTDSGAGSLRQAILDANASPGADTIVFAIASGGGAVKTIAPAAALPQVRSPVTIDATTQPGYAGTPVVELSGFTGSSTGIQLAAGSDGSVVRGLAINRWGGSAVRVEAPRCVVERNYLGTDPTGSIDRGNGGGVYLFGGAAGAHDCVVADNLISGNAGSGVTLLGTGAHHNVITGNRIGVNAALTAALPNDGRGIYFSEGPSDNRIGRIGPGEGNVIARNGAEGLFLSGDRNAVVGNLIGLLPPASPGALPVGLGNDGNGISLAGGAGVTLSGNTIANNDGAGVASGGGGAVITGNLIYSNLSLGIDLGPLGGVTPNDRPEADGVQNYPVIASAVASGDSTAVAGSLDSAPSATFRVEFFGGANVDGEKDVSGFGEGARPVGSVEVTTDAAGHATFDVALAGLPAGDVVTATATRVAPAGAGTSEFSRYVAVTSASGPLVRQVYVRSSAWSTSYLIHLATEGLGKAPYGYAVPAGAAQLAVLPWVGIDRISVEFSEGVNVLPQHLSVRGVRVPAYGVAGVTFNGGTRTATWTLATPLVNDKVRLTLSDAVGTPTRRLDGDWQSGADAFPSGDGTPGGDFDFRINVVPGDVNRSGTVLADDASQLKRKFFSSTTTPGTGDAAYSIFHDVDGSGSILADDFSDVKQRFFTTLPAGEPGGAGASAPLRQSPVRRDVLDA